VVIGTQLLMYSLAAGVCGQRALEERPVGQICPGTLEQLQGGFDSTLKLLLSRPRPQHQPNNQQDAAGAHQRKNPIGVGSPGHLPSLPPPDSPHTRITQSKIGCLIAPRFHPLAPTLGFQLCAE
jgi:hypothetical protein